MQQTPPPSNSLKRRRSDQPSFELEGEDCQIVSKKRKDVDVADLRPATLHDDSSATPLKRSVLRALSRKNNQAAREFRLNQRLRRPITRRALAEWKRRHPPIKPSHLYLEGCGHEQYEALKRFAKGGGPDLWDLRGCQRAAEHMSNPIESSQASSTSRRSRSRRSSGTKATTDAGTSKSLSPYNPSFQQILIDSHVYPPYYEHPDGTAAPEPENWDDINERLAQRRPSLSPSKFTKTEHKAFIRQDASATNEDDVRKNVIPGIQGTVKDPRTVSGEVLFTNLDPLVANENIACGKPDFYHGGRTEQVDRSVRNDLNHLIIPSMRHERPIAPNHFTAVKGPDGSAAIATRQATYDMYLGARGVNALRTYGQAMPSFDNKAYTFASTYYSGTLSLFTGHPVQPDNPGEHTPYYMNRVGSFAMLHNAETWREGATWYRNSIDLAKEWRDELICAANNVHRASIASVSPNASTSFASTGDQLGALTMGSQVDNAASGSDEEFQTAESSREEEEEDEEGEEEEEEVVPSLAEQSSRPRGQAGSGKKRQNHEYSADAERTLLSTKEDVSQPSPAAKRPKARGKRVGKKAI